MMPGKTEVKYQIFKTKEEMYRAALLIWQEKMSVSIREQGVFRVALSGGATPKPFYKMLAEQKNQFPWKNIALFMVDERYVPFDHPDSNFKMICELLVDHIPIPQSQVYPMMTNMDIAKCAMAYEDVVRRTFQIESGGFPKFDLMVNGIGDDGHTASLFPNNSALEEKDRVVIYTEQPGVPHQRITFTMPVLHQAKMMIFLVTGKNKAERIKNIMVDKNPLYPAFVATRGFGESLFLMDSDAASLLSK